MENDGLCILTYQSDDGIVVSNPNLDKYPSGMNVNLTAVPKTGYEFIGWDDDLSIISSTRNLIITDNTCVSPIFKRIETSREVYPHRCDEPGPTTVVTTLGHTLPNDNALLVSCAFTPTTASKFNIKVGFTVINCTTCPLAGCTLNVALFKKIGAFTIGNALTTGWGTITIPNNQETFNFERTYSDPDITTVNTPITYYLYATKTTY